MRTWTITDWPHRENTSMWAAWLISGDDVLVKIQIESDVPQATAEAIVNEFARRAAMQDNLRDAIELAKIGAG